MPDVALQDAAQQAVTTIAASMRDGHDLVVASPPGAGKTRLITELVPIAVAHGLRVGVITTTNAQAHQLLKRLAQTAPQLALTFAPGSTSHVPGWLTATPTITTTSNLKARAARELIAARDVLVCTADKAAYLHNPPKESKWSKVTLPPVEVDVLIVDEAWQLPWAKLLRTNRRCRQFILVGDPGQLAPFTAAPLPAKWRNGKDHPLDPAPHGLEAAGFPAVRHRLPATWRLPPATAPLISDAFYPDLPFAAVSTPGDRRVTFRGPNGPTTKLWGQVTADSFALLELDDAHPSRRDPDLAAAITHSITGLLASRPTLHDGPETRGLHPGDVAVVAAHREQRDIVRGLLDRAGLPGVAVHTANTVQGLEFEIVVVWHPLSGRRDPTGFHLDAGRLCVMLSRHRHGCLIVTRPGIPDLLARTALPDEYPLDGQPCPELTGWSAHRQVYEQLQQHQVSRP